MALARHSQVSSTVGQQLTVMPTIRCTEKLGRQIGRKLASVPDVSMLDWHANLLWLNRRKHVLFCSDATRLSCLTPPVSKSEMLDLPDLLRRALREVMRDEHFPTGAIERVVASLDPMLLAKTANRSVLGTMNDNTMHIKYLLDRYGGLSQLGLSELHHHLNHMPMNPNDWKYAIEAFRSHVVEAAA
mgnify:CR=1 FL=1